MLFISSSCLIPLARTFNTILNRSGENTYPGVVFHLRRNAFSLLPLIMMLIVDFLDALYHVEEEGPFDT